MLAKEALAQAEKLGLGLVFTEHLDLDYPGELDFTFDAQEYWCAYEPLRGSRLRLGVEIGLQPGTDERSRAFVAAVPFDLVIGSIHMVGGHDLYYKETYAGREKDDFYREYFAAMAEEIRANDFVDVLGHIDYICRYAPYDNPELSYGAFRPEIDSVLATAIETGKLLELNTNRLASRRAQKELAPIYRRYHELGGEYATLGSDAHKAGAIGANFAAARDLLDFCGLRLATFRERKMELCR